MDNPGASENTRRELEICAGQWEGGTQTGPRKEGDRDEVAGNDWTQSPGQGADVPTRAGLSRVGDSKGRKGDQAEMR